jgi:transcriptional regulator with XRE-family HTH domain
MTRSHSQEKSDLSITGTEVAEIAARIRQLRGPASQLEFARRLGITREHVSRIEAGTQPGTDVLRRLARVTGVSLDFLVLGAAAARGETATGAGEAAWQAALEPLLGGTGLRLPRGSPTARRRADRAWGGLSEERREDVRAFVRRVAIVAVAIEALLPPRAARPVVDALSRALASSLADRLAAGAGRRPARGRPLP